MRHSTRAIEQKPHFTTSGVRLQRACACGNHSHGSGECESCKKKKQERGSAIQLGTLQRAAIDTTAQDDVPQVVYSTLRSRGQLLDDDTRGFMGQRFGQDFMAVRVHNDTQAAQAAQAVDALAFTVGQNVVFGAGQYTPGTPRGQQLIAHELAHTIQQRNSAPSAVSLQMDHANDAAEQEAQSIATALLSDPVLTQPTIRRSSGIQRSLAGALGGGVGGAVVGAVIDGLVGGPIGALVGGLIGALVGGLIGHLATLQDEPLHHWETARPDVRLVADPTVNPPHEVATLPQGTRVAFVSEQTHPPDWVQVRVTTGALMNTQGWVQRSQLVSVSETTEVSPETAVRLFAELAQATFPTMSGAEAPIPFHYPPDGCYARAYRMSRLLEEKGYASERVFAISYVSSPTGRRPGLHVETPYAEDSPSGITPAVNWWYHVAPIIKVRHPEHGLQDMVLDPSMMLGPATISEWTGRMSGATFTHISLSQVEDLLQREGDYPADRPITFTAPRTQYYPPNPVRSDLSAAQEQSASRTTMTDYAARAEVHELAAEIRGLLAASPIDAAAIIAAIRRRTIAVRHRLRAGFAGLIAQIHSRVTDPADHDAINRAIDGP